MNQPFARRLAWAVCLEKTIQTFMTKGFCIVIFWSSARVPVVWPLRAPPRSAGHRLFWQMKISAGAGGSTAKPSRLMARGADWAQALWQELASLPNVRLMSRTTIYGAYDHGIYGALERRTDHLPHSVENPGKSCGASIQSAPFWPRAQRNARLPLAIMIAPVLCLRARCAAM